MKIGTRTVLYGYHAFWLHPLFVAAAWWRFWGFPWDPRLWVSFFVHDLGYWGLPDLDGERGERHPEWGAGVMERWFDRADGKSWLNWIVTKLCDRIWGDLWYLPWNQINRARGGWEVVSPSWACFALYHSRFLARRNGQPYSVLCAADKLSFLLYPWWLFWLLTTASGEGKEYVETSRCRGEIPWGWKGTLKEWWMGARDRARDWLWNEGRGRGLGPELELTVRCERCGAVDSILSNWSPVQPCSEGCGGLMKVVGKEEGS